MSLHGAIYQIERRRVASNDFCNWPISEVVTPHTEVRLVGSSGLDLLTLSFSRFDPSPTSPLRYPGYSHTLINAFALSQVGWIITRYGVAKAADRKTGIECKPDLRGGPCLIERPSQR